jgi:hypothetical protein
MAVDRAPVAAAAAALAVGLATVTTALGAVGGLTGGIARMFRNHGADAKLSFALVLIGVAVAVVAWGVSGLLSEGQLWISILLIIGSAAAFAVGTYLAVGLMVDTASIEDRPALSAKITANDEGIWIIEGVAATTGLRASEQMQVYVYSIPSDVSVCNTAGTDAAATSGPDEFVCGRRLMFVSAGPNGEGVATREFTVPLPSDDQISAFVVTANLGDIPRNCEGVAIKVQANPGVTNPPSVPTASDRVDTACMTFAPPPPLETPTN